MAEATIKFTPDTEYLEQVARTIGKHLTALADDLKLLRDSTEQATEAVQDLPPEDNPGGLRLPRHLFDAMLAHCRAEHPIEACGVMPGPSGGDIPDRIIPMINAEHSRLAYRFDPDEQLTVWQDMRDRGERLVVVYHSHTGSDARPSKIDIQHAAVPDAHWVIVSTRDPEHPEAKSFRIRDGKAVEEQLVIV